MMIIGCDFHPSWQQVAWLDTETGETGNTSWSTATEKPSGSIAAGGAGADRRGSLRQQSVVYGVAAAVGTRGVGRGCGADPGQLRAQAEDRQAGRGAHTEAAVGGPVSAAVDADGEQRDLRQLLIHRHKLVEIRTRVKNGLQHLALNRGMQKKASCGARPDRRRCASCRWKAGRRAGVKTCWSC